MLILGLGVSVRVSVRDRVRIKVRARVRDSWGTKRLSTKILGTKRLEAAVSTL